VTQLKLTGEDQFCPNHLKITLNDNESNLITVGFYDIMAYIHTCNKTSQSKSKDELIMPESSILIENASELTFAPWEKTLKWVKEYLILIQKESLTSGDCEILPHLRFAEMETYLKWAQDKGMSAEIAQYKYRQAIYNIVDKFCLQIEAKYNAIIQTLENNEPSIDDVALLSDELKNEYLLVKKLRYLVVTQPQYTCNDNQKYIGVTLTLKLKKDEAAFTELKQRTHERYKDSIKKDKLVLQNAYSSLQNIETTLIENRDANQQRIKQIKSNIERLTTTIHDQLNKKEAEASEPSHVIPPPPPLPPVLAQANPQAAGKTKLPAGSSPTETITDQPIQPTKSIADLIKEAKLTPSPLNGEPRNRKREPITPLVASHAEKPAVTQTPQQIMHTLGAKIYQKKRMIALMQDNQKIQEDFLKELTQENEALVELFNQIKQIKANEQALLHVEHHPAPEPVIAAESLVPLKPPPEAPPLPEPVVRPEPVVVIRKKDHASKQARESTAKRPHFDELDPTAIEAASATMQSLANVLAKRRKAIQRDETTRNPNDVQNEKKVKEEQAKAAQAIKDEQEEQNKRANERVITKYMPKTETTLMDLPEVAQAEEINIRNMIELNAQLDEENKKNQIIREEKIKHIAQKISKLTDSGAKPTNNIPHTQDEYTPSSEIEARPSVADEPAALTTDGQSNYRKSLLQQFITAQAVHCTPDQINKIMNDQIIMNAINQDIIERLTVATLHDLIILHDYFTEKSAAIHGMKLSNKTKNTYQDALNQFYKAAILIRLSDSSIEDQHSRLVAAADHFLKPRHKERRLFLDVTLMIATLCIGTLIIGIGRKALGHTFFFSQEKSTRYRELTAMMKDNTLLDPENPRLFNSTENPASGA